MLNGVKEPVASEKTLVPALALLARMSISIMLTIVSADRPQARSNIRLAGEMVDAALSERVEVALKTDPGLIGTRLAVVAQEGVVELGGSVPDAAVIERALELAMYVACAKCGAAW